MVAIIDAEQNNKCKYVTCHPFSLKYMSVEILRICFPQ